MSRFTLQMIHVSLTPDGKIDSILYLKLQVSKESVPQHATDECS